MRLRFQSKHGRRRYAISMTPLIDVIFLLMIFFLMTINFQKPEGVLDNRLPQLGRRSSEDPTKDWETVRLRIRRKLVEVVAEGFVVGDNTFLQMDPELAARSSVWLRTRGVDIATSTVSAGWGRFQPIR